MGQLKVTVGAVNAALNFNDTQGARIINGYIAAYEGPTEGTNQEKLDWFVNHLSGHIRAVYMGNKLSVAVEDAREAAAEQAEDWN